MDGPVLLPCVSDSLSLVCCDSTSTMTDSRTLDTFWNRRAARMTGYRTYSRSVA
jgi:hypothetical protein